MTDLKSIEPAYLASPYTRYERGHSGAFVDICKLSARIHRRYNTVIFSPIAHCHGMTMHGDLPAIDHAFWKRFNAPFVKVCGGLIVAKMEGWDNSAGVADEISDFRSAAKPIWFLDCETLELTE